MRAEQTTSPDASMPRKINFNVPFETMKTVWRLWRNRRAMRRISELSEWELFDIGVTREDVVWAYESPLYEDPTIRLQQIALARAKHELVGRRRA